MAESWILYWVFGSKNQSFRNKSGKTQPIQTKFDVRGHVKGWQRSGNFGRDRPILGKMGALRVPRSASYFCVVNHATFRQLRNSRFHQIWSRNVFQCSVAESGKTFSKIFTLGVICPQNLKLKIGQNRNLAQSRLQVTRCTAEIYCLLHVYSPRPGSLFHVVAQGQGVSEIGHLFSMTYGCGATGHQNCPIFGFCPIFPIQNP